MRAPSRSGPRVAPSPRAPPPSHTPKPHPRARRIGGHEGRAGERLDSSSELGRVLAAADFELLHEEEMPLLLREHKRKYQYIVSHAMVFQRRT